MRRLRRPPQNEDNLKNEDDIKNEYDLENWPSPPKNIEFHMINIIYAALPMHAQTEKTTFSCKDIHRQSTHGAGHIPLGGIFFMQVPELVEG